MTPPNPEVSVTAVRTRTTVDRVESVMSTTLVIVLCVSPALTHYRCRDVALSNDSW